MTATLTLAAPAVIPADGWPCSWDGCPKRAAVAMTFRDQPGHVHECAAHAAELREWCDVLETAPLPCPYPHGDGTTWTDDPTPLDAEPLPYDPADIAAMLGYPDTGEDGNPRPSRRTEDLPDIATYEEPHP